MKDPAILFYTADFLAGTYTMSNEDVGKYIRLLCLQHQKGRLSEKVMKNICITYVEDIYAKFIKDEAGLYYNQRLESEAIKRREYSESRRQNVLSRYRKSKKTKPVKTKRKSTYVKHMGDINEDINRDIDIVINDLNTILDTSYKPSAFKTRELIIARFKEGHNIENFKSVHRIKYKEWKDDPKMSKYLRPETLYGNKFESYLNQKEAKNGRNDGLSKGRREKSTKFSGLGTEV